MGIVVLGIVLAIIGVLAGWLGPMAANSRRPYGVSGDIIAGVLTMLVLGLAEWLWIIPLFGFPNWLNLAATIGDPLILTFIVLWLMRKVRPATPARNR